MKNKTTIISFNYPIKEVDGIIGQTEQFLEIDSGKTNDTLYADDLFNDDFTSSKSFIYDFEQIITAHHYSNLKFTLEACGRLHELHKRLPKTVL